MSVHYATAQEFFFEKYVTAFKVLGKSHRFAGSQQGQSIITGYSSSYRSEQGKNSIDNSRLYYSFTTADR